MNKNRKKLAQSSRVILTSENKKRESLTKSSEISNTNEDDGEEIIQEKDLKEIKESKEEIENKPKVDTRHVYDDNFQFIPSSYNISFDDLPKDVITNCRKSALDQNRLKENPDIIYSISRFLMPEEFNDQEKYHDLVKYTYDAERVIEIAKKIVQVPDKKIKKIFKSEEFQKSGGFGDVFIAKDTNLKKRIAIKKIPHRSEDEKYNFSEIGFLHLVNHPNIVKFHTAYEIMNTKLNTKEVWIIMEYLQGGTLGEAAEKHRMEEHHTAFIAGQMLLALKYLHSINYVHRDLKSANVMLSIEGQVKLIDFGLCTELSNGPQIKMLGSPYWIPPEMIFGLPHSFPADIWSLGVCLLELFLLKPPYYGFPIKCMFEAATTGLVECIPFSASKNAKDFLTKCLTQNPKDRLCAEDLLEHPWVSNSSELRNGFKSIMLSIFVGTALKSITL